MTPAATRGKRSCMTCLQEAKGSGYVPLKFLKDFYIEAYKRLRAILKEETVIMFHDGFRLSAWKDFFVRNHMKNVVLDHGRIGWTDFEGTLIVLLRFLTVEKNIKEEQELIARRKAERQGNGKEG